MPGVAKLKVIIMHQKMVIMQLIVSPLYLLLYSLSREWIILTTMAEANYNYVVYCILCFF